MKERIQILSTKILLANQKQLLSEANFELVEVDFIKTENTNFELKDIKDNLIFTSQNAVQSLLNHPEWEKLKAKNVFCVGLKTKALLNENGFVVTVYTGYASDLTEIINLIYSKEHFTFFSGNLRRETLPQGLIEAGVDFNEIKVYETVLTPQKIKSVSEGILFFSPSGVESYLKDNKIRKEICFCIGNTTAEALKKLTKNIVIAEHPTVEDTILECINEYN